MTDNQPIRPCWNQYFKEIVRVTSTRSPCERLKVGCVLIKDNRIVSQGYNGFLSGCPHTSIIRDNHEIGTIHAEQNAILDCAKRGVSSDGTIAYITHYPCFHCMKLLCGSGIKTIKYIDDYRNDPAVEQLSRITGVDVMRI